MRVSQFLGDRSRTRMPSASVRVFDAVAPIPASPAPRWWNHPVVVMTAAMVCAVPLFSNAYLSPLWGLLAVVVGAAVTGAATASRERWWPASRTQALEEARWVAAQCGYRLEVEGDRVGWVDAGGVKAAALDHYDGSWRLALYDAPFPKR